MEKTFTGRPIGQEVWLVDITTPFGNNIIQFVCTNEKIMLERVNSYIKYDERETKRSYLAEIDRLLGKEYKWVEEGASFFRYCWKNGPGEIRCYQRELDAPLETGWQG